MIELQDYKLHYQKVNGRLNYQNNSEKTMKLKEINTKKVGKTKNMMLLKSRKENLTMASIVNCVLHTNMTSQKKKKSSIKRFWIISEDHHTMRGEKKSEL